MNISMNIYGGSENVTIYFSSPSSLWLRSIWNRAASIVTFIQTASKAFYSFDPDILGFEWFEFRTDLDSFDIPVDKPNRSIHRIFRYTESSVDVPN